VGLLLVRHSPTHKQELIRKLVGNKMKMTKQEIQIQLNLHRDTDTHGISLPK